MGHNKDISTIMPENILMQGDESDKPRRVILFVCSSALHVKLFAPAIRILLLSHEFAPIIVSLDTFYAGIHGDVASYVSQLDLAVPVKRINISRGSGSNRLIKVLGSIHSVQTHGVPIIRELFAQQNISLVVFGNDTGHPERAVLRITRELNIRSLLVQDGFLFDQFSSQFVGRLRLMAVRLWLRFGGRYLGGVPYGMGACDYITTHGKAWSEMFRQHKTHQTKQIYITGHPFLDISADMTGIIKSNKVTFFSTNYLSGHNDPIAHQNQITEVLALRKLMSERYEFTITLRVKIHPADNEADYKDLLGEAGIKLYKDSDVSEMILSSCFCLSNISSVSLECLSHGRLCFMSGIGLQKGRYRKLFYSLPSIKYVTLGELLSYLEELDMSDGYTRLLQRCRDTFLLYIDIQPGLSGADRLVSLMIDLTANDSIQDD